MLGNRTRVVALQIKRKAKPFQCRARLDLLERSLEGITGRRCVARRSAAQPCSIMAALIKPDDGTQALNRVPRSS